MNQASEKTIFFDAMEIEDRSERTEFLDRACGGNRELRSSVDELLQASERPGHLLDRPPVRGSLEACETSGEELVGKMIGAYRLMEQIGEGGFGLVFVAQQEEPVQRNVALKIVKPGTGSKEVIARFEAERQAVAMMDHPNIARVFDAGVTSDGRPYFVMELVRGIPITEFADSHRLTIRERLELFTSVCAAVHHAHQKGVIHRDIKPSNVMVTLHDDRPIVKVIDFGVAKAIGQSLTDKTIYTRFFSMIGTPLYMSPEQAEMSGLDVDTRSDIFSLGVMLYELLAGATPFDRERLDSVGLDEMRRIIREEEPPRPSKRLTTLGAKRTTVSSSRRVEPNRLAMSLRGDLDWIVMKSLEKDRNRRYDSATAMALDIRRFLDQKPIQARPPKWSYLLLKFARRNRAALATGSAILMTMILGTGFSLWQMNKAISERDQKEKALQEIEQFAEKITVAHTFIGNAQIHVDSQQWDLAKADYDTAVLQQPNYYLPWVSRAQFFTRMKRWTDAADDYARAIKSGAPTDVPQWWGVASLFVLTSRTDAYEEFMRGFEQRIAEGSSVQAWEWLRNGLASDKAMSPATYQQMADLADEWLVKADAPRLAGRRPEHRPPGNDPPEIPSWDTYSLDVYPMGPRNGAAPNRRPGGRPPQRDRPGRPDAIENPPRPVCLYITGLAHLRAGHVDQAIERLNEARQDENWPGHRITNAPLAIAYHRNGEEELAIESLDDLESNLENSDFASLQAGLSGQSIPWFDAVEMLALYREAYREVYQAEPNLSGIFKIEQAESF